MSSVRDIWALYKSIFFSLPLSPDPSCIILLLESLFYKTDPEEGVHVSKDFQKVTAETGY